jgi:hypothetical protein
MHFALSLRELHKCIRIGVTHVDLSDKNIEGKIESYEATSLAPLFVDLSFIYVRRVADLFAMASRYVLFKKAGSAPPKYKDLRLYIASDKLLSRLEPICNIELLQRAFACHSGWLDRLRNSKDDSGKVQKGIRDIMEHYATTVSVSHSKAGDEPWEMVVNLGHRLEIHSYRFDLIQTLKETIKDIASLWTEVCAAAELQKIEMPQVAPYGDVLMLFAGNDDDIVGFWPEK